MNQLEHFLEASKYVDVPNNAIKSLCNRFKVDEHLFTMLLRESRLNRLYSLN